MQLKIWHGLIGGLAFGVLMGLVPASPSTSPTNPLSASATRVGNTDTITESGVRGEAEIRNLPAPYEFTKAFEEDSGKYDEPHSTDTANGNGYVNSDGAWTPSPRYSAGPPIGSTARCSDGTYSFSQHRRGTCSYHGGVAIWM